MLGHPSTCSCLGTEVNTRGEQLVVPARMEPLPVCSSCCPWQGTQNTWEKPCWNLPTKLSSSAQPLDLEWKCCERGTSLCQKTLAIAWHPLLPEIRSVLARSANKANHNRWMNTDSRSRPSFVAIQLQVSQHKSTTLRTARGRQRPWAFLQKIKYFVL